MAGRGRGGGAAAPAASEGLCGHHFRRHGGQGAPVVLPCVLHRGRGGGGGLRRVGGGQPPRRKAHDAARHYRGGGSGAVGGFPAELLHVRGGHPHLDDVPCGGGCAYHHLLPLPAALLFQRDPHRRRAIGPVAL